MPGISWRRQVSTRLRSSDTPIMAGELYASVAKLIPPHHAWRIATRYKSDRYRTQSNGNWQLFVWHIVSTFRSDNIIRDPYGPIIPSTMISIRDRTLVNRRFRKKRQSKLVGSAIVQTAEKLEEAIDGN